MNNRMNNAIRAQAIMAGQQRQGTRLAIVSSYDPNTYSVKVQYPPANDQGVMPESGWLPLGTIGVGPNWGIVVGPNIGDQVEVEFQDGAGDAPVVPARFFSTAAPPPAVPSGEIWLVHSSGAYFKLFNAGGCEFNDANGASIQLDGQGNINSVGKWTHTGPLTVDGNSQFNGTVSGNNTATFAGEVEGNNIKLSVLRVTGVQTGSGTSGPPAVGS